MVLALVGDTMGYKNGKWEFNDAADNIFIELMYITNHIGIDNLILSKDQWKYSDDTVMHFAIKSLNELNVNGENWN